MSFQPAPVEERFWAKVRKTRGCWYWIGGRAGKGYGQFMLRSYYQTYAHRVSWLLHYGDPGDKWVLHKCDNMLCVRPDHLFLGTALDNVHDCIAKGRFVAPPKKTRCKRGHVYKGYNVRMERHGKYLVQVCRICVRDSHREAWRKKYGQGLAYRTGSKVPKAKE